MKIQKVRNNIRITFILFLLLLIQCNVDREKSQNNEELKKDSEDVRNSFQNKYYKILLDDYRILIDIISLKYNLDTTVSKNIVSEYLLKTDLFFRIISSRESNTDSTDIDKILNEDFSIIQFSDSIVSKHENINRELLGHILYDIELWKQLNEINSSNE
jgi:hypothetical protein